MTDSKATASPTVHTLSFDISTDPDHGASVLIDGSLLEEQEQSGFLGFPPADLLSAHLPLLPASPPRHIPISLCSCGVAGCGSISPLITYGGADEELVIWSDFRNLGSAVSSPTEVDPGVDLETGTRYRQDDLAFDRAQYEATVLAASAGREWETPGEATARLLHALLATDAAALRRLGFALAQVTPCLQRSDAWTVSLTVPHPHRTTAQLRADAAHDRVERPEATGRGWTIRAMPLRLRQWEHEPRQVLLGLTTTQAPPVAQAADLYQQLTDVPLTDWERTFPRSDRRQR